MKADDGYTAIPHSVLEALARTRIPGEARRVVDVIIRKTYGWHKKRDRIALSQFRDATGINPAHVSRALKRLVAMKVITRYGNSEAPSYCVNESCGEWRLLPKLVSLPKQDRAITKLGNRLLPDQVSTIDTLTKDTNTKDSKPPIEKMESWIKANTEKIREAVFKLKAKGQPVRVRTCYDDWIKVELDRARYWLEFEAGAKAHQYKHWGRFVLGWLRRAVEWEKKNPLKGGMTNEQEQEHYKQHRSRSGGGMQKISEV